jgi:T5SS/PEP-CTERM-associated repeat protein
MNIRTTKIRNMVLLGGLAVALGAAPAAGQISCEWFATGDGVSFEDTLNWLPNQLPGLLDEAKFDNAGSQTVNFATSPINATASIENDTVLFNLGAQTYTVDALIVGDRLTDVGVLTVNGGHLVTTNTAAKIGRNSPASGSLFLTGGATMTNQADLRVGSRGVGYFQLDAGCTATSLTGFVGKDSTASGEALIRGTWTVQNSLIIGNDGSGTMTIDSGGDVFVGTSTNVGDNDFSDGSLTIDGAGSTLTTTAATTIGNLGTGSLTVSNGAQLTTAQFKIADDAAASVLVDGGTIVDSIGTGVGNRAAGTLTLANGGMVQSPLVTVVTLGTMNGSGTIDSSVISDGQINPGNGTGTMTVTGNFTQQLFGSLNIEIGGPNAGADYDQLAVNGLSTLGGALNVSLINGYNPANGQFVIFQGGTVSGAFAVENLPAGFTISYEADRVVISIGGVCEADFNNDGLLDFFDVLAFLDAFATGNAQADLNSDGLFDFFDVLAFLNLWSAGC